MTGFQTTCNVCGVPIWMEQTRGKWHPEDLVNGASTGENHRHVEKPKLEADPEQPVLGDPDYVSNPKLVPQAENRVREIVHEETKTLPIDIVAPLDIDRLAMAFKKFEDFKNRLLSAEDSVQIQNKRFLKKSAWRKWALACGVSDELVSQERVPAQGLDEKDNFYYRVIVRAYHNQTGRSSIGVAVASRDEKKVSQQQIERAQREGRDPEGLKPWTHEEHDIFSLAHTRAKSRAIADLVGGGEVSAEEVSNGEQS